MPAPKAHAPDIHPMMPPEAPHPEGAPDEGVHFIEKPFSPKFLAEKVRVVLDSPDS